MSKLALLMNLINKESAKCALAPAPSHLVLEIKPRVNDAHFPYCIEVVNVDPDGREIVDIIQKADGINVQWTTMAESLEAGFEELIYIIETSLAGAFNIPD